MSVVSKKTIPIKGGFHFDLHIFSEDKKCPTLKETAEKKNFSLYALSK
jgi:hypothetical protein